MSRSLSLAAYRVFSRRVSRPSPAMGRERPKGELLWMHASTGDRIAALVELGHRLKSQRPELNLLVTQERTKDGPHAPFLAAGMQVDVLETDHPSSTAQFLDHWSPDVCLWAGGALMPNLISEAAERGVPMYLVDVSEDDFPNRRHKWFPDLTRGCLDHFELIMASSEHAWGMLRRIGVPADKVIAAERLRNGSSPLPVPEDELSEVTENLAGRPLWLAAHLKPEEYDTILAAHRTALRLVHRLLLVLVPADPRDLPMLEEKLEKSTLRFARWSLDDQIDDYTQVLTSDLPEELGLWYRVAPLTFLGSSLVSGQTGCDPLEAASLGSAVLFGPHVRGHLDSYARLTEVGAARAVGEAEGLGAAVIRLIAPDHAAAMALAGWDAVTESAHLTDQLVELLQNRLDQLWADNAAP